MDTDKKLLSDIKKKVHAVDRTATIILYGSTARGEEKDTSDIDVLILIDKDELSTKDKIDLSYPLYDIEFETGKLINPIVLTKKEWETRHRITPFYENVTKEGVYL